MNYTCPVCFYSKLSYPPRDYHICPCCGTEFGNDDADFSHAQLREMWIAGGANWFFGRAPEFWNPWLQLIRAGFGGYVPRFAVAATIDSGTSSQGADIRFSNGDVPTVAMA
jgi:hypothetical protein